MTIEQLAKVCHEAHRAYCEIAGIMVGPHWGEAPVEQREGVIKGVRYALSLQMPAPSDMHRNWLKEKKVQGWTYGPVKDDAKKQHPCCVPYEALPQDQKVKDKLFIGIVQALRGLVDGDQNPSKKEN